MSSQNSLWYPKDFDSTKSINYIRPFHTFLIKIAQLCNLNCSYCYVYESPDDSWKWKPKFLEENIALEIAKRIQEHVSEYNLEDVSIIFHGGEPLLAGLNRLTSYVNTFSSNIYCKINFGIQTNGTLINEEFVNFFTKENISVGVSLDGTKDHNDRFRLYHNGSSSFFDAINAIKLLNSKNVPSNIFGGVLMVIDVRNEPREILELFNKLNVHNVNPLLPDAHYESLPPLKDNFYDLTYGKWLVKLFDIWYTEYPHMILRYFENIVTMLLGGISTCEEIGAQSVDLVVIDTNGDIEAVDTLKIVGRKATSLNMNVSTHSFSNAFNHPAISSRMSGYFSLCNQCRECEYLNNCGGGYVPHRYSITNGFINPSFYCQDLKYLFNHIKKIVLK